MYHNVILVKVHLDFYMSLQMRFPRKYLNMRENCVSIYKLFENVVNVYYMRYFVCFINEGEATY